MKEGKLVSDDIIMTLLKNMIFKNSAGSNRGGRKLLLDGFPRSLEQARLFEQEIGSPSCVLYLESDEEKMRARVMVNYTRNE
jgi:adenylate kinase family enzyme